MWDYNLFHYLLTTLLFMHANATLSDLRRCADPNCQTVISKGRTVVKYTAPAEGLLSFPNNVPVKIFSKHAGTNLDLWGIEFHGKRGYAPQRFIQEEGVYVRDELLTFNVSVIERSNDKQPVTNVGDNKNEIHIDPEIVNKVNREGAGAGSDGIEEKGHREMKVDLNAADNMDGGEIFDEVLEPDRKNEEMQGLVPSLLENEAHKLQERNKEVPANEKTSEHPSSTRETSVITAASEEIVQAKSTASFHTQIHQVNRETESQNIAPTSSFEVLDGTTLYLDPEDSPAQNVPPHLGSTQTTPTTTVEQNTNIKITPASVSIHNVNSTLINPIIENIASIVQKPTDSAQGTEVPPLLSTLSSTISDDSDVHPTTIAVQDHTGSAEQHSIDADALNTRNSDVDGSVTAASLNESGADKVETGGTNLETVFDSQEEEKKSSASEASDMKEAPAVDEGKESTQKEAESAAATGAAEINPTAVEGKGDGWISTISQTMEMIFGDSPEGNEDKKENQPSSANPKQTNEKQMNSGDDAADLERSNVSSGGFTMEPKPEDILLNNEEKTDKVVGQTEPNSENKQEEMDTEKSDNNVADGNLKYEGDTTGDESNSNKNVDHLEDKGQENNDISHPNAHLESKNIIGHIEAADPVKPDIGNENKQESKIEETSAQGFIVSLLGSSNVEGESKEKVPENNAPDDSPNPDKNVDIVTEGITILGDTPLNTDEITDNVDDAQFQHIDNEKNNENGEEEEENEEEEEDNEDDEEPFSLNYFTKLPSENQETATTIAPVNDEGTGNVQQIPSEDEVRDTEALGAANENTEVDSARNLASSEDSEAPEMSSPSEGAAEGTLETNDELQHQQPAPQQQQHDGEEQQHDGDEDQHHDVQKHDNDDDSHSSGRDGSGDSDISDSIITDESDGINSDNMNTDSSDSIKNNGSDGSNPDGSDISDTDNIDISNDGINTDSKTGESGSSDGLLASEISAADGDVPGSGPDPHDPDSITGRLLQVAEPIMEWLRLVHQLGEGLSLGLESKIFSPELSTGALTALAVLAATIVLLYALHLLLLKCSREAPLLEALNVLEHEQHISAGLIKDLQDKLANVMQLNSGRNYSSMVDAAEAARVTALLVKAQDENADLVERVQELEQEVEESTSSGLEMHAMLQDLLHSQKDTASFQEAIDNLQTMLDSQREKVESLTADLTVKTAMNDELKVEHVASRERVKTLEYQLEQVTHSLEEVNSSKVQACAELTAEQLRGQSATKQQQSLAQSYAQATATLQELQLKYDAAQTKAEKLDKKLRTREAELQVSKECLKQLKVFNDGKASKDKLRQLLDVVTVKSELSSVETERSRLQVELEKRCAELQAMQDAVQQSQQLADSCSRVQAQAEEEKSDAVSKLVVLTNYFQEKEAQLTKELESESGLRQTAESSADNVSSRIKHYEMQLLSSRTQVDGMKKELEDQEQSYRAQLAAQEQKAHESWVAARAAERKYEEAKQETGQLRSRLLLMSKESNQQNAVLKPTAKHPETTNGSLHSPRTPLDELDAEHHSLNQLDSPHNIPPPFMLPHMFPPHGAPPLPPNALPPFPPGMPPLPGMHPPPPPFLPHPHPHHHMPPAIMSDRRMPPAGRLASPPFHRRGGSSSPPFIEPPYDGRRSPNHYDRRSYSPGSEHSARYSDRPRHYSPPHRHYDRYNDRYSSPERRGADSSPDRWYNRSPDGYANKTSPVPSNSTRRDYDQVAPNHKKGKKTSTPLGPSDR